MSAGGASPLGKADLKIITSACQQITRLCPGAPKNISKDIFPKYLERFCQRHFNQSVMFNAQHLLKADQPGVKVLY